MSQLARTERALNVLAKWRVVFAGWQLGTRAKGDPESDAVRDHREATMLLRAEVSALVVLLGNRKIFTTDEFMAQLETEANLPSQMFEDRFPGAKASEVGMTFDARAQEWMKDWRP